MEIKDIFVVTTSAGVKREVHVAREADVALPPGQEHLARPHIRKELEHYNNYNTHEQ